LFFVLEILYIRSLYIVCVFYLYTYYLDLAILHPLPGEGTFDILPEIVILTCGT